MCTPDSPKSYLTSEVSCFTSGSGRRSTENIFCAKYCSKPGLHVCCSRVITPVPVMSAARWSSDESREQTTRPLSQPQFRYFRPFRIFLKIWTQRLICTPPLSTLHSSARLVMQPAMGGEAGVREACGSSKQSWCSYYVNKSKIFFTATDTDTDKEEKRKQFEFGNFLSTIIYIDS